MAGAEGLGEMRPGWMQRRRLHPADGGRSGPPRRERGAVLVEAALVVPLVMFLTFGAIEFGFAFNEQGTTRSATRSAARAASTQPRADVADFERAAVDTLDASARNLANGVPVFALVYEFTGTEITSEAACAASSNCAVYEWDTSVPPGRFVRSGGDDWLPTERNACAGETDRVGVFLAVHHGWLTGLPFNLSGGVTITSNTVMALEPVPGTGCAATGP